MLRAYKYRIYPTEEQKVMLSKTFGCCRYVYNWALEQREKKYKEYGENISQFKMQKMVRELRDTDAPWLAEVSSEALMYAVGDLYRSYEQFFSGQSKKPSFRRKDGRQHYHARGNCEGRGLRVNFKKGTLNLPKIANIPCVLHRKFKGRIKQAGVELLPSGVYRVSLLVDDGRLLPAKIPIDPNKTIGIDMGFEHFAVLSDGQKIEPTNYAAQQRRKLKLLQRRQDKKRVGSRMFRVMKKRIAKLHYHVVNRRHDHIHKLTHYLAYENQATTICVESLNTNFFVRNRRLSYVANDACIGEFYRQLEYKCAWAGKNLIKIDRFAPSSKMCSCCGYKRKTLSISTREWTCPECGTHHDRDLNAAINIKHFGLSEQQTLPLVRRKVKPVKKPMVDDRSSEPKKPCLCEAGKVTGKVAQMPQS